jgi:polyhydroxyalkanoate synthesis regulator phasin
MPEIIPYVPADLAGLRDEADLIEKLVASGAITETERKQLLDQFWAEHQADRESSARRAQFTPNAYQQEEGETMNANDIITQIEQTHSVMSAQIRKLKELTPAPLHMPATEPGGTSGLADLLVG